MAKTTAFQNLIGSEQPVLIDFFATWCGPCQAFMPTLKDFKQEVGDSVRVVKVDIDKNQQLAQELGIRSVPTIHLYQSGELKWSALGAQSKQALLDQIAALG